MLFGLSLWAFRSSRRCGVSVGPGWLWGECDVLLSRPSCCVGVSVWTGVDVSPAVSYVVVGHTFDIMVMGCGRYDEGVW